MTGGRHLVGTNFVNHLCILRDAILTEGNFDLRLLTDLIKPVGMIRNRQPEVVAAIRIVFYSQSKQRTPGYTD